VTRSRAQACACRLPPAGVQATALEGPGRFTALDAVVPHRRRCPRSPKRTRPADCACKNDAGGGRASSERKGGSAQTARHAVGTLRGGRPPARTFGCGLGAAAEPAGPLGHFAPARLPRCAGARLALPRGSPPWSVCPTTVECFQRFAPRTKRPPRECGAGIREAP